ncbi:MAG: hypothetical protein CVV27_12285 [Candidatus Melainabacteria bacterium HGW-Melainabacteria-1]|nr:MAG: hypothetical protein CVV27_12285 [Candidatus Melainabacteria bacterium HGW-Melainabacteria-1]
MATTKTIPVSPEIHRLIRHVAANYDVKIQEAAARIILAGAKALELEVPPAQMTDNDPFWQVATSAAEEMLAAGTDDLDTITASIQKVRSKRRGQSKATRS